MSLKNKSKNTPAKTPVSKNKTKANKTQNVYQPSANVSIDGVEVTKPIVRDVKDVYVFGGKVVDTDKNKKK